VFSLAHAADVTGHFENSLAHAHIFERGSTPICIKLGKARPHFSAPAARDQDNTAAECLEVRVSVSGITTRTSGDVRLESAPW
jgi:hypothetical protein